MQWHDRVWDTIDFLAQRNKLTASGLAKRAGLDPTTFNKSKRKSVDGRAHWPSTESIFKVLRATNTSVQDFAYLSQNHNFLNPVIPTAKLNNHHTAITNEFPRFTVNGFGESAVNEKSEIVCVDIPQAFFQHENLLAIKINGDILEPSYKKGAILILDTNVKFDSNCSVIFRSFEAGITTAIIKSANDDMLFFESNASLKKMKMSQILWIAKICWVSQ